METINKKRHESVLVREVLEGFNLIAPLKNQVRIIDATLGTGGHTLELLKTNAFVLGIDDDMDMVRLAEERLKEEKIGTEKYKLIQGNFKDIDRIAKENNFSEVDGILFDLGVSNLQLMDEERGFSFSNTEALLDMRINTDSQGVKALDLLNLLRRDQLLDLFGRVMEGRETGRLVKEIIKARQEKKIETVGELLRICSVVTPKHGMNQATLPFLALRIAVNSELENLSEALPKAFELLRGKGRLLVITFHSLEEKIVKEFMKKSENKGLARIINFEPIEAGLEERTINPKSRSAKLRILEKI